MKKINLKGISEILSEKELKNVMGGSTTYDCTDNKCARNLGGRWRVDGYGNCTQYGC